MPVLRTCEGELSGELLDPSAESPAAPATPSLARRASTLSSVLASGLRWSAALAVTGRGARAVAVREPKPPSRLGAVCAGASSVVRRRGTVREPPATEAGGDGKEHAAVAAVAGESTCAVSPPPSALPLSPSNARSCASAALTREAMLLRRAAPPRAPLPSAGTRHGRGLPLSWAGRPQSGGDGVCSSGSLPAPPLGIAGELGWPIGCAAG